MNLTVSRIAESLDRIRSTVRSQLHGRVYDFDVMTEQQGLVLMGSARSYYAKQLAQQAVMRHTDWPIVRNEIEVYRG